MNVTILLLQRVIALIRGKRHTQPAPQAPAGRASVFLRHLDCGSCNGCELELQALSNPIYDIERFGISFVASPRHADVLVMTGPFTRNLAEAARLTFDAMSEPRQIIAVGDCADDGGVFKDSYAVCARPEDIEQAIVRRVPGCPPAPDQILAALAQLRTPSAQ
jgi:Ni,Fe-hydrogenase III small subunit